MKKLLPEVFIGSSSEGQAVARAIEMHLQLVADTTIWMNGVFRPGESFLQSLLNSLAQFDFAVLVLTPDDVLESRDASYSSPRDNVIFEFGLFMGRIGPRRTFFIAEENESLRLPSDLSGISRLDYRRRDNLTAAVSPACTVLIEEIRKQGRLSGRIDRPPHLRTALDEPASVAEYELRVIARKFFGSPLMEREEASEQASEMGARVPLDRVLSMTDSIFPGERVATGIALGVHLRSDPDLAKIDTVIEAIDRGLDDSRSRVRYRYVEFLRRMPSLARPSKPVSMRYSEMIRMKRFASKP